MPGGHEFSKVSFVRDVGIYSPILGKTAAPSLLVISPLNACRLVVTSLFHHISECWKRAFITHRTSDSQAKQHLQPSGQSPSPKSTRTFTFDHIPGEDRELRSTAYLLRELQHRIRQRHRRVATMISIRPSGFSGSPCLVCKVPTADWLCAVRFGTRLK